MIGADGQFFLTTTLFILTVAIPHTTQDAITDKNINPLVS
jgi:hypothetical protein